MENETDIKRKQGQMQQEDHCTLLNFTNVVVLSFDKDLEEPSSYIWLHV